MVWSASARRAWRTAREQLFGDMTPGLMLCGLVRSLSQRKIKMASLLFTIQVTAEYQQHGDGNNELYVAQAFAPNGEKLHYRAEAINIGIALEELVKQVRRRAEVQTRSR